MSTSPEETFDRNYARHLQHLTLKGLQPKSIEAYSRAIRRIGERFDHQIDALSEQQLLDYFTELVASHSWSSVKLDSILTTTRYTHLTDQTKQHALERINRLMDGFSITWVQVK
ncbi:MAG: phage integrase N-terminal SAM-like domain-containing protein [Candidatus Accumulibacter sp. UW25]|jgi:integrase/recombinase XerD